MNSFTRRLFEQLGQFTALRKSGEAETRAATGLPLISNSAGGGDADEQWKRDLLELLFMAPGVVPPSSAHLRGLGSSSGYPDETYIERDDNEEMDEEEDFFADDGDSEEVAGLAVVQYGQQAQSSVKMDAAEEKTRSAASLLRALRELKRVDAILQGCTSFWANMDGTVQKLAQMKDHTEQLVNFASNSARLKERFEQRLREYTNFWASLQRLCRQYCADHQAASSRMDEFIREVSDLTDWIDTTESVRTGVMAAQMAESSRGTSRGHDYNASNCTAPRGGSSVVAMQECR